MNDILATRKITTKKHKKMPNLSKIAKFWNKVVYGGYVPAPYTWYKNGSKNIIEKTLKRELRLSFLYYFKSSKLRENSTLKVANRLNYDIIKASIIEK